MLFDSHAHLTSSDLYPYVDAIVQRAVSEGVQNIVNICTDPLSLERGIALSNKYPFIYQTAATTPHDVEKEGEEAFPFIAAAARKGLLVAIGETGLDYYYAHSPKEIQKHFFIKYLHLALECHLPVVIHCREAFKDFFEILDVEYRQANDWAPGVLHCFTGNTAEAEEVVKRGWMLSMSGIVTFKKSHELQEIAKNIPLEYLLIETDAPFLAPGKYRGKQNEPAYLKETARFIADLRNISYEELATATARNTARLLVSTK